MRVAVTSPSFSKHPELISAITSSFNEVKLNSEGIRFTKEELIEYLKGYDAAIVGLDKVDAEVLLALPNLKVIAKYGVGLDNIDLEACKSRGVEIGWTGGVNKTSVAEMTLGNILSLLRNLYVSSNLLSKGVWKKDGGVQLSNKTIGIIGVGFIGKELIKFLKPFNCTILVNDIVDQSDYYTKNGLINSTKEEIFEKSDVVTIHTPLTKDTFHLINEDTLKKMKDGVVVVNSARGGIVDEVALLNALNNNKIRGAALDVYEIEPPVNDSLLSSPKLICTPHIGGNAQEAIFSMGMSAINHLLRINK